MKIKRKVDYDAIIDSVSPDTYYIYEQKVSNELRFFLDAAIREAEEVKRNKTFKSSSNAELEALRSVEKWLKKAQHSVVNEQKRFLNELYNVCDTCLIEIIPSITNKNDFIINVYGCDDRDIFYDTIYKENQKYYRTQFTLESVSADEDTKKYYPSEWRMVCDKREPNSSEIF